jgi:hypothetical protein
MKTIKLSGRMYKNGAFIPSSGIHWNGIAHVNDMEIHLNPDKIMFMREQADFVEIHFESGAIFNVKDHTAASIESLVKIEKFKKELSGVLDE